MRIAICDDEALFRKQLAEYIENIYHDLDLLVKVFASGEELLRGYQGEEGKYNIILLDIELKGITGMEVAKQIRAFDKDVRIIFLTSHDEFASVGYEVSAFRFLVKPVIPAKLVEAIEAAKKELSEMKTIFVKNSDGVFLLKIHEILYIEASNQDVLFVTTKEMIRQRHNIDDYEHSLAAAGFFRVHRSYLINMKFVKRLDRKDVILANDLKIPVSRLRRNEFEMQFHAYIKRTVF